MCDTLTPRHRPRSRSRSRSARFNRENKPIRVWIPGSFDFLHFRQVNFLRRVKQEMSLRFPKVEVVIGLYSDEDIEKLGRKSVFSLSERYDMLRANKWVDEIVKGAPLKLSKEVLKEYACDYTFLYTEPGEKNLLDEQDEELRNELIESELLKTVPSSRSHFTNISAEDLINRIMQLEPRDLNDNTKSGRNWVPRNVAFPISVSCKELLHFSDFRPKPASTDKVVYMDGSFDLLHPEQLSLLEKAKSLGDYLLIGLHGDEIISKSEGKDYPFMQWNERLLALLSCKYVSEVIIDAPMEISKDLLDEFSVSCVVASCDDYKGYRRSNGVNENTGTDRYAIAKQRGIFHEIEVDKCEIDVTKSEIITTVDILKRVHENWRLYSYALNTDKN